MIRIPTHRTPTHPGEMLLEEFLIPMDLTRQALAEAVHLPYEQIREITEGRRDITPAAALRLAKFFGMSPDFWMNLQLRWDIYHAEQSEMNVLESITPFKMRGNFQDAQNYA
jgi:addiction module HigA family antidote